MMLIDDLSSLIDATKLVAKFITNNNIVVYRSTVILVQQKNFVPILSQISKLKYLKDFTVGYSPERINPGDNVTKFLTLLKL